MKNKKISVFLIAILTIFATLLCLYSNKLSTENITASKIITGNATSKVALDECTDNNCSNKSCPENDCENNKKIIDPRFSKRPKNHSNQTPIIGKRNPKNNVPKLPKIKPNK